MYVGLSQGARGAARRAARLLRQAAHARGRGRPAQGRRRRPGVEGHLEADGRRRLGRRRLAEGVGRPGPHARSSSSCSSTSRCARARRCRCSRSTRSRRRSCGTAPRSRSSSTCRRSSKGEIHFAIGYTEPDAGTDLASLKTQRRARRRRVRDQRPEGVHEPRERRRLHLARGAHEPGSEEAQGHLDHHRAHRHARLLGTSRSTTSAATNTNITYYEDVRVPVGNLVGEENGGWGAHHQPAQPRARHAVLVGRGRAHARRRARAGRRRRSSPTAAA